MFKIFWLIIEPYPSINFLFSYLEGLLVIIKVNNSSSWLASTTKNSSPFILIYVIV